MEQNLHKQNQDNFKRKTEPTAMIRKYTKDTAGFSFVELMVVIALIGVLSAIALPSLLGSLSEKRLKNAARNLYADMQKVRLLAVKKNTKITVIFDVANGTYSYIGNNNDVITVKLADYGDIKYGKGKATTLWDPPGGSIDSTPVPYSASAVPNNNTLLFSPNGTTSLGLDTSGNQIPVANTGANIYLTDQNNNICYAASINQFGSVKLRRFSGSSWE